MTITITTITTTTTTITTKAKERKYRVTIKLFSKWLKSTSCTWKVNKGSRGWLSSFVKSDWNPLLVRERTIREVQGDYLILRKVTEIYFFYVTSQLGCSGLSLFCWKWQKSTSCTLQVNKGSTGWLSNFVKSDWKRLLVREKATKEVQGHYLIWLLLKSTSCTWKAKQRKYRVTIKLFSKWLNFFEKILTLCFLYWLFTYKKSNSVTLNKIMITLALNFLYWPFTYKK